MFIYTLKSCLHRAYAKVVYPPSCYLINLFNSFWFLYLLILFTKSSIVFFVEGIVFFFSSIVLWIVYIAKKGNKKKVRASFASFGCFVLSLVFLLVPVYSIANIYGSLDNAMKTEGKPFYEEYPEYEAYTPIFKALETLAPYTQEGIVISDLPLWISDAYSFGDTSKMSKELSQVDNLMYQAQTATDSEAYAKNEKFLDEYLSRVLYLYSQKIGLTGNGWIEFLKNIELCNTENLEALKRFNDPAMDAKATPEGDALILEMFSNKELDRKTLVDIANIRTETNIAEIRKMYQSEVVPNECIKPIMEKVKSYIEDEEQIKVINHRLSDLEAKK